MTTADAVEPLAPRPLWQTPVFHRALVVSAFAAAALSLVWGPLSGLLAGLELALARVLPEQMIRETAWFLLPAVGFGAGVLASLSPCILPIVPLNVAYIGASEASGWAAARLSARFVLGAALVLAVLGLAGDLAGWVLIEQRGPVLIGAGLLMALLGLVAVELIPLPGAGRILGGSRRLGPVGAGAVFSLVTSPCASPLLAGVLAAAAAQSMPGLGLLSMLGFALGYTLLVFVAGVFGGSLVGRLRGRSFETPRALAGALLVVAGVGFAVAGLTWF